jgi:hypothetical protein
MTRFAGCARALFIVVLMAAPAFSQSRNTGEIRGTVSAGGAVLPGATVTVTNIDTGEKKDFVTNQDGIYDTVSTPTGNYNISFSSQGFKKLVRGPITLQIDVITEDAALQVGNVTETVEVSGGGVPLLETETTNLGAVLEAKTIQALPQIGAGITGNDWANFNILLPGAEGTASGAGGGEGSGNYNAGDAIEINGNLPNYANYLQDGAVVQLPVSNNVDNLVFEAVQEVQVTTSSFSSEYGIGGAVFNQISKGGSNGFHGSAYEFWQNNILNARPYFDTLTGPGGAPEPQQTPYLRYDEWGGSIGGPIIKNKLFFYFVRDKIYNLGAPSAHSSTVPTLAERGMGTLFPGQYDFSALTDSKGNPITIYDPATTSGGARTQFANNVIPANRIDPVAAKLLSYYPLPNAGAPGALTNNFNFVAAAPNPNLRYFGRIDYDLSQKHRISFSISQKDNPGKNINSTPCPLNCFSGDIDGYNAQVTLTSEISPTLVNSLRMSYTKQGNWFVPQTIGFDAAGKLGLQYAKANVFPVVNVSGGCCVQLTPGTNAIYIEGLYDPSDVLTLVRGKHILHFGVEVLMGDGDTTPWGNINSGTFGFTGAYTSNGGATNTGTGLADFLLGDVENWGATNQKTSYARLKSPQLFVQDDVKVRPNLTLNLGLRYVATTGFSEIHNSLGGFDPDLVNPTDGSLGYMWFAGQDNRTTLQKPSYAIFLPRVGFAWSVRNDTVVRGGFGMYSYNYSQDTYGNGIGAGALSTSTGGGNDLAPTTAVNPFVSLSASAAVANPVLNYVVGSPNANNPGTYYTPGKFRNETLVPYRVPPARINEWQLSVEHQFGKSYMASIAYVGSKASNLQFPTDYNQVTDPGTLATFAAANAAGTLNSALIQPNRPFKDWGNLGGNNYIGISRYNALQTAINKRFSNGLLFSVNYVWSHFLDDQDSSGWGSRAGTQFWQIGNNPAANYGNSNFDIPNAFKGYAAYDLPFGRGRSYLSGNRVEDAVVGGWRVSGTFIAQSGVPFTITTNGSNNSFSQCGNGCSWYPNVVGSPFSGVPAAPAAAIAYFNPTAYASATPGTFGNEVRNSLRGPDLKVVNLSLAKDFHFGERVALQIRGDFVNALNHPSFNPPGNSLGGSNFGVLDNATGVSVAPRSGQLSARVTF